MNTLCHDVTASICEYAPVLGLTCKTSHQPGQLNITDYFTVEGMTWALQYGYKPTLNMFQLLMQHGAPLDVIKTIDWTYVPNEDFSEIAARAGHLDALKWALDNGCPWDEATCAEAARGGHLHVLKWLRDDGCPWDEDTCSNAAREGHLQMLKWARENGCPWNERTCSNAAHGGHLQVLKWARENGCPYTETRPKFIF